MEDSAVSNRNPERLIFNTDQEFYKQCRSSGQHTKQFVRDGRGWILFGPYDIRGANPTYLFCLQKLPRQSMPRVRVGCRYYTLAQAYRHWSKKARLNLYHGRNEGRQALAIIQLMLLQAQAYHLLPFYATPIKFDSSLLKSKSKR
jgi:hypothetical protein